METTTALAWLDPHATGFALAVARPTVRSLLSGQRHAIALQAERAQLAAMVPVDEPFFDISFMIHLRDF
jgi:hypothetical protein